MWLARTQFGLCVNQLGDRRGEHRSSRRIAVLTFWLPAPAKAQATYSYSQLRLAREIASATHLAEVCGGRISQRAVQGALRSEGLREQDMAGSTAFRDEMAKQRIAIRDTGRDMRMVGFSESETRRRDCAILERSYGPHGVVRPGLAILSGGK